MSAEKIVQALFAELEKELDDGETTSAAVAGAIIRQLGKTLTAEMKSNQDFRDRIAQIVEPNFMPSPVAILQRSGAGTLSQALNKHKLADLKGIATGRNLATKAELNGLQKPQLISLIVDRAEKEARSQR
jgi:hypothetical protein